MSAPTPSPVLARWGVSLMFFTNGVLVAGLMPRYPEIKAAFGLSGTQFGFMVVAMSLGAITAANVAGPIIRRFGTRRCNAVSSVALAVMLTVAAHSPVAWGFAAAMFLAGVSDAIADSAQNVQGVVVEQWRGRSIINSFHALWSLGATTGGLVGTWAATRGIPVARQMLVGGIVWGILAVVAAAISATPHDDGASAAADDGAVAGHSPRPWRLLLPLVVLAICGALMEEVANSWSALFLGRETDAPTALAGLGFTTMLAAQFVGRMLGDPMTDRWGREAVARAGGLLAAAGMTVAILSPTWSVVLVGFALMGFGSATLVPAAFAAAARVPGLAHGSGIAILGWLMRLGFLVTSPVIGVVSDLAGLRAGLVVPLVAGLTAAYLSHRLSRSGPQVAPCSD